MLLVHFISYKERCDTMRAAGYRIHRASCVSAVLVRVTNYKKTFRCIVLQKLKILCKAKV